jgi:hypothetical protein
VSLPGEGRRSAGGSGASRGVRLTTHAGGSQRGPKRGPAAANLLDGANAIQLTWLLDTCFDLPGETTGGKEFEGAERGERNRGQPGR